MSLNNGFIPFRGPLAARVLTLLDVSSHEAIKGLYATILNSEDNAGYVAKIKNIFHTLEKWGGIEEEVFTLEMTGNIIVRLSTRHVCLMKIARRDFIEIASLIVGQKNRVLCTKEGYLK